MSTKKSTRNAPEPEFTFEVLLIQPFQVGALDDLFAVNVNTPFTVIGDVDPGLVPTVVAVSGSEQKIVVGEEPSPDNDIIMPDAPNVVDHVVGRSTYAQQVNYKTLIGDIPIDSTDLVKFAVWGTPTYGVDPDAECTNRPAFGLLYPRRAT